jgi:hypothetical protein
MKGIEPEETRFGRKNRGHEGEYLKDFFECRTLGLAQSSNQAFKIHPIFQGQPKRGSEKIQIQ